MVKRHMPRILILAGCVLIGVSAWIKWDASRKQMELVTQYERFIAELDQRAEVVPRVEDVQPTVAMAPSAAPATSVAAEEVAVEQPPERPERLLGILTIPKIDLTVAIAEGTDDRTLLHAVGHFPETVGPGESGNFSITGHRGHIYGPFFLRLGEVEVGDAVVVKSGVDTFTYTVTASYVVAPEDTWVLDQTDEAEITLITCTPLWINTHRLIVKGVLDPVNAEGAPIGPAASTNEQREGGL